MKRDVENSIASIAARLMELIDDDRTPQIVDICVIHADDAPISIDTSKNLQPTALNGCAHFMTLYCQYFTHADNYQSFDISFECVPTAFEIQGQFTNHKKDHGYRDMDSIEISRGVERSNALRILSGSGFCDNEGNPIPKLDITFEFQTATWHDA